MDKERKKRCKEKIALANDRLNLIEETLSEFEDEKLKLACYKAFQEAVEVVTDLIAMILVDKNKIIEDDYSNINKIKNLLNLSEEETIIIREANGLRNRLVHKYNRTDDNTAKESIINLLSKLKIIIDKFEKIIENAK